VVGFKLAEQYKHLHYFYAKTLKNYSRRNMAVVCLQRCREEDPTLVTKYKPRKRDGERTAPGTEEQKPKKRKDKLESCEICKC
jgi:hypothetical protein